MRSASPPAGNAIRIEVQSPGPRESGEAFAIATHDGAVRIAGNSPLAALYGAYEFLEQALGVRWYAPDELGEVVPPQKTIAWPELNLRRAPSFPMRWIGTEQWALRNKQNSSDDGFTIRPCIYHTQEHWLPRSRYFGEHPEYYALVKGKRSNDEVCKLCTSNPAVAAEVARNMSIMLDQNSKTALVSFSPTDGGLYCECPRCKSQDELGVPDDQRMSRRMLLFYNALAAELRKRHPEARILVGAYHVYARPLKDRSLKADPMLSVIICHYEDYCMAHPVPDPQCPPNGRYRELIRGWQDLGCKVYFYEYYWKLNWLDLPWPIVHCLKRDMPWYRQQGVQGVYTQYNAHNAWMMMPGYYVSARLLWDSQADADAIMARLCEDLFGKAAPAMKRYYRLLEERMAACGRHFPGRGLNVGPVMFTDDVRAAMHREYQRAGSLNNDPVVAQRLAKIGASIEYTDRVIEYANLAREACNPQLPRTEAAPKFVAAYEHLQRLEDDLRANPAKWSGVVSRLQTVGAPEYVIGPDLEEARRRAILLGPKNPSRGP